MTGAPAQVGALYRFGLSRSAAAKRSSLATPGADIARREAARAERRADLGAKRAPGEDRAHPAQTHKF